MKQKEWKIRRLWGFTADWFSGLPMRVKLSSTMILTFLLLLSINYFLYSYLTKLQFEKNLTQTYATMSEQSSSNLASHLSDVAEGLVLIRTAAASNVAMNSVGSSQYTQIKNRIEYNDIFNQILATRENYRYISSMAVLERDGPCYFFEDGTLSTLSVPKLELNFGPLEKELEDKPIYYWSGVISDKDYLYSEEDPLIRFSSAISYYGKMECIVMIHLRASAIQDYLDSISNDNCDVVLMLPDGGIISCRSFEETLSQTEGLREKIYSAYGSHQKEVGKYMMLSGSIPQTGWQLGMMYSIDDLHASGGDTFSFLGLITISTAAAAFLFSILIAYYISRPIRRMTEIMAHIDGGHLDMRFQARYTDEVGRMAQTFNHMMDKIENLNRDIVEEQERRKLAYLKMLQMQIKPHFLYNSLEAAKFLAEMGSPHTVDMIESLGRFYKLSLEDIREDCTVKEELEHLECYLQILKMRYQSRLTYRIQEDPQVLDCQIVRFSLQPLVENAVYHGVKQKRGQGKIVISAIRRENTVEISVYDNGAGISPERLEELRASLTEPIDLNRSEHLGVNNVHQRLQSSYGPEYGLSIESIEGEYTLVVVRIPFYPENRQEGGGHV